MGHYGIGADEIDNFASHVKFKKGTPKLPKSFFSNRIVKPTTRAPRPHARCFAAEVLAAIQVLDLFSDVVLVPNRLMAEHVRCMKRFVLMMGLLRKGAAVV